VRSKTAPAVLGRLSLTLGLGPKPMGELRSRSVSVREMSDEMLPERECPGRAVAVLEASLETRDNGRGMYSSVSEKPTRFRVAVFAGRLGSSTPDVALSPRLVEASNDRRGLESDSAGLAMGGKS